VWTAEAWSGEVKVESDREGEEQLSGEKAAHQHAQSAPYPQQLACVKAAHQHAQSAPHPQQLVGIECTTHACMAV
jgi:hypothetical protein